MSDVSDSLGKKISEFPALLLGIYSYNISGSETRHIPLHLLQPWQTQILCGDSDYFWDSACSHIPLSQVPGNRFPPGPQTYWGYIPTCPDRYKERRQINECICMRPTVQYTHTDTHRIFFIYFIISVRLYVFLVPVLVFINQHIVKRCGHHNTRSMYIFKNKFFLQIQYVVSLILYQSLLIDCFQATL